MPGHLDRPVQRLLDRADKASPIADVHVHPQVLDTWETLDNTAIVFEQHSSTITVGDVGWVDQRPEHKALCVSVSTSRWRLRPSSLHLLAAVIAAWPPFSVVLTVWLSMMAALGCALRFNARRERSRNSQLARSC